MQAMVKMLALALVVKENVLWYFKRRVEIMGMEEVTQVELQGRVLG